MKLFHAHDGEIRTNTEIATVDPVQCFITDAEGNRFGYRQLVWAADNKLLYRIIETEKIIDQRLKSDILERREMLADKVGNDSVLTLYLAVDLDKSYFSEIASEHFFYTPNRVGQSVAGPIPAGEDRQTIESWLEKFFSTTTYEISCPVLRDSTLAPEGKTGLVISVLFDYALTKNIEGLGWYEDFKILCENLIINNLNDSIYPGIKDAVIHKFSSTPLTMEEYTGNTHGAITGWAFTNQPMPAESKLPKIFSSTETPIPGISQAGQWTYSPSGLPISILTGKLAADRVIKELKKSK
ncbi:MAG: hypothetical protein GWN30_19740 [Gammaproteobacteria bacterium]|nr:hypothetical protein [Gammaproteobacteria bacterium]